MTPPSHQTPVDPRRLIELIDGFNRRTIAVIGDLMADEFIYGRVERVSREAPVLILRYDDAITTPGGAGNAANNVAALGARVRLAGLVGRDQPGRRMLASLHARISRRGVVRPSAYATPVKTRILAGGVHSAKQQVVRIDRVDSTPIGAGVRRQFERAAMDAAAAADAVLISDYGSGLVTPALVERIATRVNTRRRRRPILVDSRYAAASFRGVTACTPNESEVEQLLGVTIGDDRNALERAGRTLLRRMQVEALLITRGSRGMALFEPGRPTEHIPIWGSDEIADVTGAGDTVIATMTLAVAAGAAMREAARLANYAGGIVVMKRGTATVSPAELRAAVRDDAGR